MIGIHSKSRYVKSCQFRLPEQHMTIGIGVICSTKPKPHKPRPDAIIMVADTMGSTETDSTDDLHKMWLNDELNLYAVGADRLEYGSELFTIIENEVKVLESRTHGTISGALNKAFQMLRAQHFQWDIAWGKLQIPGLGFLAEPDKIREEWRQFYLDVQMIVGTFDNTGQGLLYIIGQSSDTTKVVHLFEFPGYATIGAGGINANFWLNYRRQSLRLSVQQSAYHAYEAKQMAAKAPTVNDAIEIAIVLPGQKSFHLTEEKPDIEGCPVSLAELKAMFGKYGPQNTFDLGHPKPSVSRKSKEQP